MEKIYKSGKAGFLKENSQKMRELKKSLIFAAVSAVLLIVLFSMSFASAAYKSPIYIANPETRECQYYFTGESDCFDACMNDCQGAGLNYTNYMEPCANQYCHYNLKPKGFTVELGATSDFKDLNESCRMWQNCVNSGGGWNSTTLKCLPKPTSQSEQKSSDFPAILSIAVSVAALIIIILLYLKIRKMLRQIHVEKK